MKKVTLPILIVLCLTLSIKAQTPSSDAQMFFDTIVHDFGSFYIEDLPVSFDFYFTNTGNEPLIINKAKSSSACVKVEYSENPIKQNERGLIKCVYSPTITSDRSGKFSHTIAVYSNASNSRVTLRVRGCIRKLVFSQNNGKWGLEKHGESLIPFIYDTMKCEPSHMFPVAKKNGKWGVLDSIGNVKIPFIYDKIENIRYSSGDKFYVCKQGKWGMVNIKNEILASFEYDSIDYHWVHQNNIIVKKNNKWGLLDTTNRVMLPVEYDSIKYYDGVFLVKKGKWGLANKEGVLLMDFRANNKNDIYYSGVFIVLKENNRYDVFKRDGSCKVMSIRDNSSDKSLKIHQVFDYAREKGLDQVNCSDIDSIFLIKHSYVYNPG